jgi:hypothetical protein
LGFINPHRHRRSICPDFVLEDSIGILRSFLGVIAPRLADFKKSPCIKDDGSGGTILILS